MKAIKCKNGKIFSACSSKHIDAEWLLQESYYKAQGCVVEESENGPLEECDCDHCKSLEHKFDELIEEVCIKLT